MRSTREWTCPLRYWMTMVQYSHFKLSSDIIHHTTPFKSHIIWQKLNQKKIVLVKVSKRGGKLCGWYILCFGTYGTKRFLLEWLVFRTDWLIDCFVCFPYKQYLKHIMTGPALRKGLIFATFLTDISDTRKEPF